MKRDKESVRARWARLRFSIIGTLLAAPPESGTLQARIRELAAKDYQHPVSGEPIQFSPSTIERWLYTARKHDEDPVVALARKAPSNTGHHPSMSVALERVLRAQYREHASWSYQLHYDNLAALAEQQPDLGAIPSYSSVRRFMKARGMVKQPRRRRDRNMSPESFEGRETRSFEVEHVHALWHADFHAGSRPVLLPSGQWAPCYLLGVLDDRSRLACHLQWYLQQTTEVFVHGLSQALLKRGLPRALLTDRGSAMMAAETTQGLHRLSILHCPTLPYSPEQNAKQEVFWAQVEGRLMPMLESERGLTLSLLNQATQAWAELEYNHKRHSELGDAPLQVALGTSSLGRPAPESETLRRAFRTQETRTQRISDGTLVVHGTRFELPSRYRTLRRPTVRFARWDLCSIALVDPHTEQFLCELYPLDKHANADGRRRRLDPVVAEHATGAAPQPTEQPDEPATDTPTIAPLLQNLMAEYAATGLPPAYIPHSTQTAQPDQEGDS